MVPIVGDARAAPSPFPQRQMLVRTALTGGWAPSILGPRGSCVEHRSWCGWRQAGWPGGGSRFRASSCSLGVSPWPGRSWPRSVATWPSGRGVCAAGKGGTGGKRAGSGAMDGVWRKAVVVLDRTGLPLSARLGPALSNVLLYGEQGPIGWVSPLPPSPGGVRGSGAPAAYKMVRRRTPSGPEP